MEHVSVSGRQGNRIKVGAEINIRHSVARLVAADVGGAAVAEPAVVAVAETLTQIRTVQQITQ